MTRCRHPLANWGYWLVFFAQGAYLQLEGWEGVKRKVDIVPELARCSFSRIEDRNKVNFALITDTNFCKYCTFFVQKAHKITEFDQVEAAVRGSCTGGRGAENSLPPKAAVFCHLFLGT